MKKTIFPFFETDALYVLRFCSLSVYRLIDVILAIAINLLYKFNSMWHFLFITASVDNSRSTQIVYDIEIFQSKRLNWYVWKSGQCPFPNSLVWKRNKKCHFYDEIFQRMSLNDLLISGEKKYHKMQWARFAQHWNEFHFFSNHNEWVKECEDRKVNIYT